MRKKLGLIILVAIIASAGMGVGYAVTNGTDVNPMSTDPDVFYVGYVAAYDNEVEKDVGSVSAWLSDEYQTGYYRGIGVEILGAYPTYEVYIDFIVENTGEDRKYFHGLITDYEGFDYDPNAMDITLSGNLAELEYLEPGQSEGGTLVITVLNTCQQSYTYEFTVGLAFDSLPPT